MTPPATTFRPLTKFMNFIQGRRKVKSETRPPWSNELVENNNKAKNSVQESRRKLSQQSDIRNHFNIMR